MILLAFIANQAPNFGCVMGSGNNMQISSIQLECVLWVHVAAETKPGFIHQENKLRVNYSIINISEEPVTILKFWK
jgi:hypothetical protein